MQQTTLVFWFLLGLPSPVYAAICCGLPCCP